MEKLDSNINPDRYPDYAFRPLNFQLVQYGSGQFDSKGACESASTNCKANYFGLNESDPYVSRMPCEQLTYNDVTKWYNVCEMKANRLRDDSNLNKFDQEFKPSANVTNFPKNYIDFLTPICGKNPNHSACKEILYNMKYNSTAMNDTNVNCDKFQADKCKHGRYGNITDPVYSVPAKCERDAAQDSSTGAGVNYPHCVIQSNLITEDNYANVFYVDFEDTPDTIPRNFTLAAHCEKNPTSNACADRVVLFEEESWSDVTVCRDANLENPPKGCANESYDDVSWRAFQIQCAEPTPGVYKNSCTVKTNVEVSEKDAKTLHRFFNTEVDSRNELAYGLLMRPYCSKPENAGKPECITNSTQICRDEPWRASCGGKGDNCLSNPTSLECSNDCTLHPWMTVCGGDGNACPFEPNSTGCEQCQTQPWLTLCGGDGDMCKYNPNLPECQNPECATKPWLVECGGDGNMCKYNPNLPECQNPECTTQPWLLSCGGTGDRCDFNADFPECVITKNRHPFVWIALLIAAIIVTYMMMKKRNEQSESTDVNTSESTSESTSV